MAEEAGNCLPYGQFGLLDYDIDDKTWSFTRNVRNGHQLKPLGEATNIAKSSSADDAEQLTTKHEFPGRRLAKQLQDLMISFPSTLPAADILSAEHGLSETVTTATSRHDPGKGDLLAFGTIASEAHHRPIRVAAFPAGQCGTELRVTEMKIQRQGWHDATGAWLEVPIIRGDEATWTSDGTAIQQVCFAESGEERGTFMALRMLAHTMVFRPILRKIPVRSSSPSRLDLNPVADVSLQKFGGLPHADVSFNSFYPLQFAVVDQAGCWSIFEFEGRQSQTLKCLVFRHHSIANTGDKPLDDGWARILWCGSPTVLAVATRRFIMMFDTSASTPEKQQSIEFESWILGVALIPSHQNFLCVLTTSYVEIHRVVLEGRDESVLGSLRCVLKWRHFRSSEDITLGVVLTKDDEDVNILIRSSSDHVVTSYRIQIKETQLRLLSDPSLLELPLDSNGSSSACRNFKIETVKYGTNQPSGITTGRIAKYHDTGTRFYCLTTLRKDLELQQMIYYVPGEHAENMRMKPPTWYSKINVASTYRLKQERLIADDDELNGEGSMVSAQTKSNFHSQNRTKANSNWTVGLESVATEISEKTVQPETQMPELLASVEMKLHDHQSDRTLPLQTVLDSCPDDLVVQDVDEASAQLQELTLAASQVTENDARADDPRLKLRSIPLPRSLGMELFGNEVNLSLLYDQMIGDWISPLPAYIPGRIRTAKASALLQTAVEMALAAQILQPELPPEQAEETEDLPTTQLELPLRRMPSPTHSTPSVYVDASSQMQSQTSSRTEFQSAASSQITGSSRLSAFLAPRITRMSRYTAFSTPPVPLPRSMETVIAHWDTATDPNEYDWLSTQRHLARRRDAEDEEELTERDRAKVQRRAERHIRRQRREAAASEAALLASSQAPGIAVASQPASFHGKEPVRPQAETQVTQSFSGPGLESSQVTTGAAAFPASQVVPGRFGGRPPPRKKAKRKQGF